MRFYVGVIWGVHSGLFIQGLYKGWIDGVEDVGLWMEEGWRRGAGEVEGWGGRSGGGWREWRGGGVDGVEGWRGRVGGGGGVGVAMFCKSAIPPFRLAIHCGMR